MVMMLRLTALNDCILPPFTSKVTRLAFKELTGTLPSARRRSSFSVLFRDGKPLYRRLMGRGEVSDLKVTCSRGDELTARVSLLMSTNKLPVPRPSTTLRMGMAELRAEVADISVSSLESLSLRPGRVFRVSFLTPTLLPVPGRGELLKVLGVKRRYKLVPDLALALALLSYDLRLMNVADMGYAPVKLFNRAYKALAELDFKVWPETVLYTVRDGKAVTERGFRGYVTYELLDNDERLLRQLSLLLGYANTFGVGKSRSIGFGHVSIESLA